MSLGASGGKRRLIGDLLGLTILVAIAGFIVYLLVRGVIRDHLYSNPVFYIALVGIPLWSILAIFSGYLIGRAVHSTKLVVVVTAVLLFAGFFGSTQVDVTLRTRLGYHGPLLLLIWGTLSSVLIVGLLLVRFIKERRKPRRT